MILYVKETTSYTKMLSCFKREIKYENMMRLYHKFQLKCERNNKMVHMYDIGQCQPQEVYYGNKEVFNETDILRGLCSLCDNPIHIAIGYEPNTLILSRCSRDGKDVVKGETFFVSDPLEDIRDISQITQYHIYNAIQAYCYIHNKKP